MSLTIDLDALVASVRKQAAERPGYVYDPSDSRCIYQNPDGSAGCIVGHAFQDLGFTPEQIQQFDATDDDIDTEENPTKWSSNVASVLRFDFGFEQEVVQTDPRVNWLRTVQRNQDMQHAWGAAVEEADSIYPLPQTV